MGLFSAVGLPASCPYDIDSPLPNEFVIEIVSGPGMPAFRCGLSGAGVALGNKASLRSVPGTSGSNVGSWERIVGVYARIENPKMVRKFMICGERGGIRLIEQWRGERSRGSRDADPGVRNEAYGEVRVKRGRGFWKGDLLHPGG